MNFSFDSETQETYSAFELLKPGDYNVVFSDVELKDTSTGGALLLFTFEVCDAEFAGRKLFHRCNVVNNSDKAVEIGRKELASILVAAGRTLKFSGDVLELDSAVREALHDSGFVVKVGIERDKEGKYNDKNTIKQFMAEKKSAPKSNKGGWK